MLITDQIENICLFELEDSEVIIVKKALYNKAFDALNDLYSNSLSETRRALEEIIDLIGYFLKYGNDEIETIFLTNK